MRCNIIIVIYLIFIDAVHATPQETKATDSDLNKYIAAWFRNSVDRAGGSKLRKNGKLKKNEEAENSGGSGRNNETDLWDPNVEPGGDTNFEASNDEQQ